MGKTLIIKGADFSQNAVENVTIWEHVTLLDGGWLPNYNTGQLTIGTNPDLWGSAPVNVDGMNAIYGYSVGDGSWMRVLFYSGLPTADTSTSLYIGKIRQQPTTIDSYVTIPPGAKYAVFFDEGQNVSSIAKNGDYYIGDVS